MKQSNKNKEVKEPSTIEQFYIDHKKKGKHEKQTKCPMAKKNCKEWDPLKERCKRGWCGI